MGRAFWNSTMQLRVELRDITPPIWRRLVVPAECKLDVLHEILQIAFGWTDSHLHGFEVGPVHFGMPDVENELLIVDERHAPLGAVANKGDTFVYEYDFGDGWDHDVLVEEVNEETMEIRLECLDGARAGPPEDCGGTPGYENLVAALTNPKHPDRAELLGWVGRGYDPERFDLARVNKKLAAIEKRLVKARAMAMKAALRR